MSELKNHPEASGEQVEQKEELFTVAPDKKPFVEPAVSVPLDVLETTSFYFQDTTIETSAA